ncbi:MAG: hypothetical protein IPN59_01470 [Holophaga sp.]|nr:hypothetical protein [Holophaga sp.]
MYALRILVGGLLLGLLFSCGGGAAPAPPAPPPTYATQLTYAEPLATGWRFVKYAGTGTTADPLILELRGPATPRIKGIAFMVDLGTASKVAWASLAPGTFIAASPNLTLGSEPRLLMDKLIADEMQVGIFQKTGDADPSLGVVRLALTLKAGQARGEVTLFQNGSKAAVLSADGSTLTPLNLALGALKAE